MLHHSRLPAGGREHEQSETASPDAAFVAMRFAFTSYERNEGWLRPADADGFGGEAVRLSEFVAALPCFTPQIAIATETGPQLAGDLQVGARVLTRDHGPQAVHWVGRRRFGWRELGLNPALRPIRIAAGALGDGVPAADMLVSPNHRFLAALPGQRLTDETERLWQARALLGREGVTRVDAPHVEYVQLLLDRHELVLSEGAWSESFQPSAARLAALAPAARAEILAKVPALQGDAADVFASVRPEAVAVDAG
ncbi:Hint domain-containing protein [Phaeovulum sp.]|uniref:Hint domain-containing protein n=1 Tax=Phaeovulum sp. TaxID=2934796 RepID=UPI003565D40B